MKNKGFIAIALLIGAMGCSINLEEDLAPEESNDLKLVFAVDSFIDGDSVPDTKTSVVPNENYSSYDFRWSAKDTVGIYPDAGNQVYFSMAAGAGATSAEFDGGAWTCKNGHEYRSYYPFIGKMYLDATKIPVSFTGQKQIGNTNSDHFQQCDYMYTGVTTKEGSLLNFAYHHLVTVVSPWLELPAGHYTDLTLSLDEPLFVTEGRYDLTAATPAIVGTQFSSTMHMDLDITLASADILRAFVLLAPINMTGHPLTITVTDENDVDYQYTYNPQRAYVAGTVYRLRASTNFADPPIAFADDAVKAICVDLWDTDSDGELSMSEAAAVTSIPYSAFSGKSITSFDEFQYFTGVTSLGYDSEYDEGMDYYGAFYNCTSLTSITLPPTLQTINYACFRECANLEEITIPASVQTIQQIAFLGCTNLVVHMESDTPCTLQKDSYGTYPDPYVFGFLTSGRVKAILVPDADAETAYKAAQYWPSSLIHAEGWIDPSLIISFADPLVKFYCLQSWDENGDGELSYVEAAAVTDISTIFQGKAIKSFDEFKYFTGVSTIKSFAFQDCTSLESISFPPHLTTINSNAFYRANKINKVSVPSLDMWVDCFSTTSSSAFDSSCSIDFYINDDLVTELTFPSGRDLVPRCVFANFSKIETVVIPVGVKRIWPGAFSCCTGLKNVNLPEGLISIEDNAFAGCSSLTSIVIPNSVTYLSGFKDCTALNDVIMSEGIKTIAGFQGCTGLTSLIIPDGVTSIGNSTFDGCTGLTNISLPAGLTTIGNYAFRGCTGLTEIIIPEEVTSLGTYAFSGCEGLSEIIIPGSIKTVESYTFEACKNLSVIISEGVEKIKYRAFSGCENLTVSLPTTITSLSSSASGGGASGNQYTYSCGAFYTASIDNITIFSNICSIICKQTLWQGWTNNSLGYSGSFNKLTVKKEPGKNNYTIPNGFFSRPTSTSCPSPAIIEFEYGLGSISESAFENDYYLHNVFIPESVQVIENKAFKACSNLESISIPSKVFMIGEEAFRYCGNLTSIRLYPIDPPLGGSAMFDNTNDADILVPESSLNNYKEAEYWNNYISRIKAYVE